MRNLIKNLLRGKEDKTLILLKKILLNKTFSYKEIDLIETIGHHFFDIDDPVLEDFSFVITEITYNKQHNGYDIYVKILSGHLKGDGIPVDIDWYIFDMKFIVLDLLEFLIDKKLVNYMGKSPNIGIDINRENKYMV